MKKIATKTQETAFYLCCGLIMGGGFSILGPSLPYIAEKTNRSLDQVSDLFLIMPLGFILGIIIFRYFAHKDWLKPFFVCAILAHLLLIPIIPYSPFFLATALLFLLIAVGRGIINLSGNILLLELHKRRSGPYLTAFHFCFGFGAALLPFLVGFDLEHNGGIALSYLFFALLNLPLLVFILRFKTSAVPPDTPNTTPRKSLLKVLALIYVYLFCYVFVEAGYGIWIFSYMSESEGGIISVAAAGVFTSAYFFAFTIGRLVAIPLTAHFHPIKLIVAHSVLCLGALIIIILYPQNLAVLWAGNIGLGWGLAVMFPCIIYYSKQAFNMPAKMIGNYFIAALAGAMAGPWLLGQVFVIDRQWIFYPMLAVTLMLPILVLVIRSYEPTPRQT